MVTPLRSGVTNYILVVNSLDYYEFEVTDRTSDFTFQSTHDPSRPTASVGENEPLSRSLQIREHRVPVSGTFLLNAIDDLRASVREPRVAYKAGKERVCGT